MIFLSHATAQNLALGKYHDCKELGQTSIKITADNKFYYQHNSTGCGNSGSSSGQGNYEILGNRLVLKFDSSRTELKRKMQLQAEPSYEIQGVLEESETRIKVVDSNDDTLLGAQIQAFDKTDKVVFETFVVYLDDMDFSVIPTSALSEITYWRISSAGLRSLVIQESLQNKKVVAKLSYQEIADEVFHTYIEGQIWEGNILEVEGRQAIKLNFGNSIDFQKTLDCFENL